MHDVDSVCVCVAYESFLLPSPESGIMSSETDIYMKGPVREVLGRLRMKRPRSIVFSTDARRFALHRPLGIRLALTQLVQPIVIRRKIFSISLQMLVHNDVARG